MRRIQADSFLDEIGRVLTGQSIVKAIRLYRLDPGMEDSLFEWEFVSEFLPHPATWRDLWYQMSLNSWFYDSSAGHANRKRVTNDLRQNYRIIYLRPIFLNVSGNIKSFELLTFILIHIVWKFSKKIIKHFIRCKWTMSWFLEKC